MKSAIKVLFALLAISISSGVAAQTPDWYAFGEGRKQGKVTHLAFIEMSTLTSQSGISRAWTASVYMVPLGIAEGKPIVTVKTLMEFNCSRRTSRSVSIASYDMAGDIIRSNDIVDSWGEIIPGSIGSGMFRIACGNVGDAERLPPGVDPARAAENIIRSYRERGLM